MILVRSMNFRSKVKVCSQPTVQQTCVNAVRDSEVPAQENLLFAIDYLGRALTEKSFLEISKAKPH